MYICRMPSDMIQRTIQTSLRSRLFQGKVILLTGPRQVGKTTFLKQLAMEHRDLAVLLLNCDEPDIRLSLELVTSTQLRALIGDNKLVLIDEAQRVSKIGLTLKLIVDAMPEVQVVATGSSAFEIRDKLHEPLTGRKFEYHLYPFSTGELVGHSSSLDEKRMLEQRLLYGMYPEVINHPTDASTLLRELINSYLFKDIFTYQDLRRPDQLHRLLTALALQIGNEVSYNEIAQLLGIDKETVERYIDLLEMVFVVFRLNSFSRNMRNELKKSKKIYFYDNGVRNAMINNFAPLALRTDTGALWENFFLSERRKFTGYHDIYGNPYFWRTHSQQEIDYIEERDGVFHTFETKWSARKMPKIPRSFAEAYPNHTFTVVTPANYFDFLT